MELWWCHAAKQRTCLRNGVEKPARKPDGVDATLQLQAQRWDGTPWSLMPYNRKYTKSRLLQAEQWHTAVIVVTRCGTAAQASTKGFMPDGNWRR